MNIISLAARRDANLRSVAEPTKAGAANMSTVEQGGVALETLSSDELLKDVPVQVVGPIRVHGKFFFAGDAKHFVKGVTYGPFAVGTHGSQFPERAVVGRGFVVVRGGGINTGGVFTVPPVLLLVL